jgi:hypothetical protein
MSTAALVALMTGVVLGMRFKFFILVPATLVAVVVILAVALAHGDDGGSIMMAILITAISLQAGYVVGLFARHAVVMMRAARMRRPLPAKRAVSRHAH